MGKILVLDERIGVQSLLVESFREDHHEVEIAANGSETLKMGISEESCEGGHWAAELIAANKELAFQCDEKEKLLAELITANKELVFQNDEKADRAAELIIADIELTFQNDEKEKRAAELIIADIELAFQNDEKADRAAELVIANTELAFQNEEKADRAAELVIANIELAFQNEEKADRAAELIIADKELAFQNEEKGKRAAELVIANRELAFQSDEKGKRAAELVIANRELAFQNEEKADRAAELVIANIELAFQNEEKADRAAELITAKQYYKSLFENNNDAVYSFDLQGNFLSCNAVLEEMFGYSKEELLNSSFHHLIEPGSLQKTEASFMETIRTLSLQNYETTCIHKNGDIIELNVINLPIIINKELIGVYGIAKNITEKIAMERSLIDLAYRDYLTDLPNRRMFEEQLDKQLRLAQFYNKKLAVLLINLDRFKSVNDTLGHSIGDALLKQLANKLQNCLGEHQTVYRVGGDEFCVVLSEVESHSEVMSLSDKIRQIIKEQFLIEGFELNMTASVGISHSPEDGITVECLLKNADTALYFSKLQGRDQAQCYSSSLNVQSFKQFSLSNDLRKALEKEELFLQYMPRVDAQTTQILGAEALIRWNHPDWGLVSPTEFIPIAEETGLIVPIGEWVLREACKQTKQWQDMGLPPMIISVNFSVQQLLKQNILQTIDQIVEESGVSPDRLEIEITESSFINNENEVTQLLVELKKRKMKVALDDFGTGYSSLYLLKQLPLDTIKIDKSFVDDILTDSVTRSILECILNLAKALQMNVVAEGVETAEQYAFLKEQKCNEIQGYYFSRPIDAEEFVHLLKNKHFSNKSSITKQEKPITNRTGDFGVHLENPLGAGMTIVMFKGREVDLGSTKVFITRIGPSGLTFLMGVRLPVNDDIILKFETEILNQSYELHGNIVWINEIKSGEVYEYGVTYTRFARNPKF